MTAMARLRGLALVVGLGDFATGLGLLVSPELVLQVMGVGPQPGAELWLRWIGAFVFGVGLATIEPARTGGADRLRGAMIATATVRLAVATALAALIVEGVAASSWWLVAAWDTVVAGLQLSVSQVRQQGRR